VPHTGHKPRAHSHCESVTELRAPACSRAWTQLPLPGGSCSPPPPAPGCSPGACTRSATLSECWPVSPPDPAPSPSLGPSQRPHRRCTGHRQLEFLTKATPDSLSTIWFTKLRHLGSHGCINDLANRRSRALAMTSGSARGTARYSNRYTAGIDRRRTVQRKRQCLRLNWAFLRWDDAVSTLKTPLMMLSGDALAWRIRPCACR
jgi:hypothetical protein